MNILIVIYVRVLCCLDVAERISSITCPYLTRAAGTIILRVCLVRDEVYARIYIRLSKGAIICICLYYITCFEFINGRLPVASVTMHPPYHT